MSHLFSATSLLQSGITRALVLYLLVLWTAWVRASPAPICNASRTERPLFMWGAIPRARPASPSVFLQDLQMASSGIETKNPLTRSSLPRDVFSPEPMVMVSLDGSTPPPDEEGTMGGCTSSDDDEVNPPVRLPDAPVGSATSNPLEDAHADEVLTPGTLPQIIKLAMESAEVSGRTGVEKRKFAIGLVQGMIEGTPVGPDRAALESLTNAEFLSGIMCLVASASRGEVSINTRTKRSTCASRLADLAMNFLAYRGSSEKSKRCV